jgi:hypothetical protein
MLKAVFPLSIGIFLSLANLAIPIYAAEPCDLQRVQFTPEKNSASNKSTGKFQATQVTLESEPGAPKSSSPTFNMPMQVQTKSGKICKLGEGIWESKEIYVNRGEDLVAGSECSGSECSLTFYALSDCAKRDSIPFAGPMRLEGGRFLMKGACEYLDDAKSKAYCSPAKIYDLVSDCKPKLNEKESLIWTRKIYGVEFATPSNILNPHTSQAKVTKP